ncbi:uncharacterized protein LOC141732358 isoform X1 [Larus michahellis]|uniref:uncharacterized protein LOC141732358 isoform X1 n=1 Tax=Larus michahellis TaxID=119627 RepID=UPI003D9B9E3D
MGCSFSTRLCCVTCGTCRKREVDEANKETSETKPILKTSGETLVCVDTQLSPPGLEVSKQHSEEVQSLSQDQQPSADAAEENGETFSAVDPMGMTKEWEAAWDSTDFSVAPADGQTEGEAKVPTQLDNKQERETEGNTEEKIKPVLCASEAQPLAQTAQDANLVAGKGQPDEEVEAGSDGNPCTGTTFQERNILNFLEITGETAACQGCEIKPPAETGEGLIGRNLLLCAAQTAEETETYLSAEHMEETAMATLAEISPQSTERAELTCLADTASLLTVQGMYREAVGPLETVASGMAERYPNSSTPCESLYPEGESLVLADQLLDYLPQETRAGVPVAPEMESLRYVEPAELSEVSCQSSDGDLGDLENEESTECDAGTAASEAKPQHRIMQQTTELPGEPLTCVQIPVKQEADFPDVALLLPKVPGSSGETETENVEASETAGSNSLVPSMWFSGKDDAPAFRNFSYEK